jgi:hypothetical protein
LAIILDTSIKNAQNPSKPLPNAITSFNYAGWERYGRNFIETWKEYWSPNIRLTVYYEGEEFEDFEFPSGMSWRPIEEVEFLQDYLASLRFPIQHGIVGDQFDMWLDARQARKAFMQMHAMRTYGGKVFWIDADCVTVKHVPERFLDDMLPDDALNCYLGRDGWYHTESGFIGFNGNHPKAREFAKNYLHVFLTGSIFASGFFGRAGWNDCCGFDAVRHVMGNGEEYINIAKDVKEGHMHPFQVTAPGQYMKHLKGNRKDTGELRPEDTA